MKAFPIAPLKALSKFHKQYAWHHMAMHAGFTFLISSWYYAYYQGGHLKVVPTECGYDAWVVVLQS